MKEVNGWQVIRSGLEGLIPWRTPGGRLGRAAITATGDVMINWTNRGGEYTTEEALEDFAVCFIGDLVGGGIGRADCEVWVGSGGEGSSPIAWI